MRCGGIVIADQYLGPDVPGAIKLDFDFTYRPKVNADAIESGVMFAEWDDHLNPKTAELAKAKGVTAADDQKIMEAYARRLRETLGERVEPEVSADSPRVLLNVLEKHGVTYLAVINDNRAYDERSGRYQAIMEKLVPKTVALTARSLPGPVYVYDLLERKALPANRKGGAWSFTVNLGELGGKLLALYPVQPARVAIGAPDRASRGQAGALTVSLSDKAGKPMPGLQPLRLTVTDPQGRDTEYSDYHCAERGRLTVPFTPARNDAPGTWRVRVEDLTAGLSAERTFAVK